MKETLRILFKKNSDYIKTIDESSIHVDKKIITRKLNKIPYYINKLYGENSFVAFSINSIRDNGSDWFNMTESLKAVGIKDLEYSNPKRDNYPDVINMIIDGLNNIDKDDKQNILDEYNKYEKIKNKVLDIEVPYQYDNFDDIKKRIISEPSNIRLQISDIQMILNEIERRDIDLGIIFMTYNYQKGSDIYFLHTNKLFNDTQVLSFYHAIYNNDYILSNIIANDKLVLTISELRGIDERHNIWIKHKDGIDIDDRPSIKIKKDLDRLKDEKVISDKKSDYLNERIKEKEKEIIIREDS